MASFVSTHKIFIPLKSGSEHLNDVESLIYRHCFRERRHFVTLLVPLVMYVSKIDFIVLSPDDCVSIKSNERFDSSVVPCEKISLPIRRRSIVISNAIPDKPNISNLSPTSRE